LAFGVNWAAPVIAFAVNWAAPSLGFAVIGAAPVNRYNDAKQMTKNDSEANNNK